MESFKLQSSFKLIADQKSAAESLAAGLVLGGSNEIIRELEEHRFGPNAFLLKEKIAWWN